MIATCIHCGQTLPGRIPDGLQLSPMQMRIYQIVHRAGRRGIPIRDLIDHVYHGVPNGSPEFSMESVHVQIYNLNKRAKKFRKCIRAEHGRGTRSNYVLVDL